MKTDRLTLLVTPDEKAAINARAEALNITASELVRRAVKSFEPEFDEDKLQILASELARVVKRTDKKVDATLAQLESFRLYFTDASERRAAIRAEMEAEGIDWPFDSNGSGPNSKGTVGKRAAG